MSKHNQDAKAQNQRTSYYTSTKTPSEPLPEPAPVPEPVAPEPAPVAEPTVRLLALMSYTKKGREVVLRWSGAGDLQRAESTTGTWVTVASASPVTLQASSATNQSPLIVRTDKPIAYYRVKRRS